MRRLPLLAFVLLAGCVAHLTPSVFTVPEDRADVQDVERALAAQGVTPWRVDPSSGIVETPWESTGENTDGTIWAARYVITVARGRVTVAMDLRTCRAGLGHDPTTGQLDGSPCERLPEGTTPEMYQGQLEGFAARLRDAMGGAPVAS